MKFEVLGVFIASAIYLVVFFLSLGIGLVASMLGVGGGFLLVPMLMFSGLSAHSAVGTGVSSAMFTGLSSLIEYDRQGRVDWKLALILEGLTVPGSIIGSYATNYVSPRSLELLFAFMLIIVSSIMLRESPANLKWVFPTTGWMRKLVDRGGGEFSYTVSLAPAFMFSFLAGVSVGFFGISGGILKVPILVFSGVPVQVAVATSSLMISLTSATAFTCHTMLGNVDYRYLLSSIPGVAIGAQVGARISHRTQPKRLRRMFSMILLAAAASLILKRLA